MEKIISNIIYGTLWLLSKLPFAILYLISDVTYLIIYYIVGYRKTIVRRNISSFFPDKTLPEIKAIEKQFYKHFADLFVEMIKSFSISSKELNKRFKVTGTEVLDQLYEDGKSVIINGAHYGNWEWNSIMGEKIKHHSIAIYSRIKNKFLNDRIKKNRGRFGLELLVKHKVISAMHHHETNQKLCAYGFLSDQTPNMSRAFYWSEFMGKRVPVLTGAEVLAKKHNLALVYLNIEKIKRGFYTCHMELMTDTPRDYPDFELTERFLEKVTAQINAEPAYYLWSHNRLKNVGKEHLKPPMPKKTRLYN